VSRGPAEDVGLDEQAPGNAQSQALESSQDGIPPGSGKGLLEQWIALGHTDLEAPDRAIARRLRVSERTGKPLEVALIKVNAVTFEKPEGGKLDGRLLRHRGGRNKQGSEQRARDKRATIQSRGPSHGFLLSPGEQPMAQHQKSRARYDRLDHPSGLSRPSVQRTKHRAKRPVSHCTLVTPNLQATITPPTENDTMTISIMRTKRRLVSGLPLAPNCSNISPSGY
jgi:hypothetical protein